MIRYLIDTDVLIDLLRGNAGAAKFLDSLEEYSISIITAHELIVGARNRREAAVIDSLITSFRVHAAIKAEVAQLTYELLKRHAQSDGLRTFDALIASTAISEGLTLISRNRKHYHMISGLQFRAPEY